MTLMLKCLAEYKNLYWLWGSDWKFRHKVKVTACSSSWGLLSDAQQLSRWQKCTSKTFLFLHTLPLTKFVHLSLTMCFFLSILCVLITNIFCQEFFFGSTPKLSTTLLLKVLAENDVKIIDIILSNRRCNTINGVVSHPPCTYTCKTTYPWLY